MNTKRLSWSIVIDLYRGMKKWHFVFLLGPYGWGKQRWIAYHKEW